MICILTISLISIYATHNVNYSPTKMTLICRQCNIEIDDRSDHPEHELMTHYSNFHNNLIVSCMRCMPKNIVIIILRLNVKVIVQAL